MMIMNIKYNVGEEDDDAHGDDNDNDNGWSKGITSVLYRIIENDENQDN